VFRSNRDACLLEVCRYVDLNPVRARVVRKPEACPWSSYRAHVGQTSAPAWLEDTEGLHGYLLGRPVRTAADSRRAADRYARLVASVPDASLWDSALRQQIYLGDEAFVERMQGLAEPRNSADNDIPRSSVESRARSRNGCRVARIENRPFTTRTRTAP